MVATDGHRLAYTKAAHTAKTVPFEQQLLPRKILSQIRAGVAGQHPLYLAQGGIPPVVPDGRPDAAVARARARFPQYERVLVRDNPNRAGRAARPGGVAAARRPADQRGGPARADDDRPRRAHDIGRF
jgi:hypothetical protein